MARSARWLSVLLAVVVPLLMGTQPAAATAGSSLAAMVGSPSGARTPDGARLGNVSTRAPCPRPAHRAGAASGCACPTTDLGQP